MTRENIDDIYELSPMQQGMLFHSLFAPESGIYIEQSVYKIHGNLNASAFVGMWEHIINRYPVLRTAIYWQEHAKPLQVVYRHVELRLEEEDWSESSSSNQNRKLENALLKKRKQGFELSNAPLMHLKLIRLATDAYYFIWSWHHIILDRWSKSLIFKEMVSLYKTLCKGNSSKINSNTPYGEYIGWLHRQDLSKSETFWRKSLHGFSKPISIGNYEVLPPSTDSQSSFVSKTLNLSTEITNELLSLVKPQKVTLNTLVQGVWAMLLSRYSGHEDIVYGVTISGRTADIPGIESMAGLLINTLPMRVRVAPKISFEQYLREIHTKQSQLDLYGYSALTDIHNWCELPANVPLFQSILVFENIPNGHSSLIESNELKISHARSMGSETNYPLNLIIYPKGEIQLKIIYDQARFDDSFIIRMLGHFHTLCENIIADSDQPLSSLQMLSQKEKGQVITAWNRTKTEYPSDLSIHKVFEDQANRTPDAIAIKAEGKELTYRNLNDKANQLAHYLQRVGIQAETLVGICVNRSLEMIVGMLGILKAGGAYLPLDPGYPKERLAFMIEDSRIPILLTQFSLKSRLADLAPANAHSINNHLTLICLDRDWEVMEKESKENVKRPVDPDSLAYVMYTSGSTGTPKGVMITHRGVVRLVKSCNYISICREDKFLQFAPISFDASTFEIWGSLLNGAKLTLFPAYLATLDQLGEFIINEKITIAWLTSTLFNQVVDCRLESLNRLKMLLIGGEALSKNHVRKFLDEGNATVLINGYGPTESTTFTCCYTIPKQLNNNLRSIPIGRPISNTLVFILDKNLRIVPTGIPGELYVGGAGLARGYTNQHQLTTNKFIPNPFSDDPGSRLYKSGDLAQWLADGTIEFLGRLDNQVKIRGFRIELGEISSVLAQHKNVEIAFADVKEKQPGDKYLMAYFVTDGKEIPDTIELKNFLKKKLPEFMIPTQYMRLKAMPLSPNGKIDRQALPQPISVNASNEHIEPRTILEKKLAEIWCSVLKIKKVGVLDNFFELGGNSLSALQLSSQIKQSITKTLPLSTLFEKSTISELAAFLGKKTSIKNPFQYIAAINSKGNKPPFFMIQGENDNLLSNQLGPDQPYYRLATEELEGRRPHFSNISSLAEELLKEIMAIQSQGTLYLGGYCFGALVAFAIAQKLQKIGYLVPVLVMIDPPFPRTSGSQKFERSGNWKNLGIKPLNKDAQRHFNNLNQLRFKEKIAYCESRIRGKIKEKSLIEKFVCKLYSAFDLQIPEPFRLFYTLDIRRRAMRNYIPKPFLGNLVIFKRKHPQTSEFYQSWQALTGKIFDYYEIPGNHRAIGTNKETVNLLAMKLKECLKNAV